jgi:hypothetical protein
MQKRDISRGQIALIIILNLTVIAVYSAVMAQGSVISPPTPIIIATIDEAIVDGEWLHFTVRVSSSHEWIGVENRSIVLEIDEPFEATDQEGQAVMVVPTETVRVALDPNWFQYQVPLKDAPRSQTLVLPEFYVCTKNHYNHNLFINTSAGSGGEVRSTHQVRATSSMIQLASWNATVTYGNTTLQQTMNDQEGMGVWFVENDGEVIAVFEHEGILGGSRTPPHLAMDTLFFVDGEEVRVFSGDALDYLIWDHRVTYRPWTPTLAFQQLDWFSLYVAEGAVSYGSSLVGPTRARLANNKGPYYTEGYRLLQQTIPGGFIPVGFTEVGWGMDIIINHDGWIESQTTWDAVRTPTIEDLPSLPDYLAQHSVQGEITDTVLEDYAWYVEDDVVVIPASMGIYGGSPIVSGMISMKETAMLLYHPHLPNGTITAMTWDDGSTHREIEASATAIAMIRQDATQRGTIFVEATVNTVHASVSPIAPVTMNPGGFENVSIKVTNLGVQEDLENCTLTLRTFRAEDNATTDTAELPFTLLAAWEEDDQPATVDDEGTEIVDTDDDPPIYQASILTYFGVYTAILGAIALGYRQWKNRKPGEPSLISHILGHKITIAVVFFACAYLWRIYLMRYSDIGMWVFVGLGVLSLASLAWKQRQ